VHQVILTFGFMEEPDVQQALSRVEINGVLLDPAEISYFTGREPAIQGDAEGMYPLLEHLFVLLSRAPTAPAGSSSCRPSGSSRSVPTSRSDRARLPVSSPRPPQEPGCAVLRPSSMVTRLLVVVSVACCALVAGSPAQASCAGSPSPSAHRFTGVVVSTTLGGRRAEVRTDAGTTVEVRGTPVDADNAMTSVDRSYEVGGRYEFHPVNDASPYTDSACTATRLLSRAAAPSERGSPPRANDGDASYLVAGLAVIVAGAAVALRRRRSGRATA
jgi:hypothetical protein